MSVSESTMEHQDSPAVTPTPGEDGSPPGDSDSMSGEFHVTLEVRTKADGQPVCYKQDGSRFPDGQSNTVKLKVETPYVLTVTFRPPKMLQYWLIKGEKMEFSRIKPKKEEDDASVYETQWTSMGVEVTKRQARTTLPIELEFEHGVTLRTSLQTKFYPSSEEVHSKWGPPMHAFEFKCSAQDGNTFADVLEEKIF